MVTRILNMAVLAVLAIFLHLQPVFAQNAQSIRYVTTTTEDGETLYLPDNRKPALYTGNFGDCLGSSLVNVTRFDAAYYQDNMTVLFHLQGNTALANESLMMYIGVYAYGESRFDLTFNPCSANIASLCPMNRSVPIEANGIIPVAQSDVAGIPSIALAIPDFEGQAILRIFANSTQSEIACYSAVVTNGGSFSQPKSVGSILGIFTFVALLASFATAIYGESIPIMRTHYAHSLSVGVVFAVFQHIFFTGALSMNWPSVLVAWWSNFAWAGGIINSAAMQSSIDKLIGNNVGNTSQVGAAGSGTLQESLGGGYDILSIYRRDTSAADLLPQNDYAHLFRRNPFSHSLENALSKRALANASTGYTYYGTPVGNGLPLPGNYSGFAGTLAQENIRVSNAFMTAFLWLLILLVILVAAVVAFKWILEALVKFKALKQHRLAFFRQNWISYALQTALRILFLAWFAIMFYTMFEFSYQSSAGVKIVAALVFVVFFVGTVSIILYAYIFRASQSATAAQDGEPDQPGGRIQRVFAPFKLLKPRKAGGQQKRISMSGPLRRWNELGREPSSIHEDEAYIRKFGWLAARFRRSRWWFFGAYTLYEFVRACFYAGASGHPMTQVFGLLVVETLAFIVVIWAQPFEGKRLNVLVVYLLGFSKVATVALSAAFDISFNLNRITTTAIGIVIIVIQGILTIVTMIAILVGAISSYMSMTRNQEDFRPKKWAGIREKYFYHMDRTAREIPRPRTPPPPPLPEDPKEPYFNVASVRRLNKIDDGEPEMHMDPAASNISLQSRNATPEVERALSRSEHRALSTRSRAVSMAHSNASYGSLPFGARPHRQSWSTRDFVEFQESQKRGFTSIDISRDLNDEEASRALSPEPFKDIQSTVTPTRRSKRSATMPSVTPTKSLRTMPSTDSIIVGGDMSNHDTVGTVPMPAVRPRAGTYTARSRVGSMYEAVPGESPSVAGDSRRFSGSSFDATPSKRRSTLAPTQEEHEALSRQVSRDTMDRGKQRA
ncbi:hypothetical protein MBLNU457_g0357t1 [Dothideomycetes sp. NU457]